MDEIEIKREESIRLSREIIKLSKTIIYSVHRNDLPVAEKSMPEISSKIKKLMECKTHDEGHFRTAIQEFVEAACFLGFAKKCSIPSQKDLDVPAEHYLLGICDLSGELVRLAINSAIKGDYKLPLTIREFLDEVYGEMLKFDFRNSDLRRKFDGIKYDLKKLEDLALDIRMREK